MNTYERYGITQQLLEGKRLVIVASYTRARRIFTAITDTLNDIGEAPDSVSVVNGREKIEINGGRLTFATSPEDLPYTPADHLLITSDIRDKPDFYEKWILSARGSVPIEVLSS